jgi:hemerythrin
MPALLKWSDSLSVGVVEIDAQHKTLISNLNDLADAMSQGKANAALRPLLARLVAYTQMHFGTEEKYMKQWGFSGYLSHNAEHEAFVKKVAEFQANYEAGKLALSIEVLHFLKDWVSNHIQGTDKKNGAVLTSTDSNNRA